AAAHAKLVDKSATPQSTVLGGRCKCVVVHKLTPSAADHHYRPFCVTHRTRTHTHSIFRDCSRCPFRPLSSFCSCFVGMEEATYTANAAADLFVMNSNPLTWSLGSSPPPSASSSSSSSTSSSSSSRSTLVVEGVIEAKPVLRSTIPSA